MQHAQPPNYSAPIILLGKIATAFGLVGIIFWPEPGAYTLLVGLGLILLWFCIIFSRLAVIFFITGTMAGAIGGFFEHYKLIVIPASIVGTGCATGMIVCIAMGAHKAAKNEQKRQKMVKLKKRYDK